IVFSHWGIRPVWLSSVSSRRDGLINVRFENLRDRPTFRNDLALRRCMVLADGFYEWKATKTKRKIPYRITRRDGKPFAFAGIWQEGVDAPRPRIPAGVRGDFAAGTRSTLQIEARLVAGIGQEGVNASPPRFAIITTAADSFMWPIHSRMAVN